MSDDEQAFLDDLPPLASPVAGEDLESVLAGESDLVHEVADPLLPPDATAVGVDPVSTLLPRACRVTFCASDNELGGVPLDQVRARGLIERVRRSRDPVVITARCEGPDLVVRTIEIPVGRRRVS